MHKNRKLTLYRACWFMIGTNDYEVSTYFCAYK